MFQGRQSKIGIIKTISKAILQTARVAIVLLAIAACAKPPPEHPSRVGVSAARNFRDPGGYATAEGLHIKKGILYRSDRVGNLSPEDVEIIVDLGVRTVYDLRSEKERERDPQKLSELDALVLVSLPIYYEPMDPEVIRRRILDADVKKGDFHQMMVESYRAYALDYCARLSPLIRGLAESGDLPALIHCTHGKDRTGVAIAITLRALGVPQETILEDYMLSNEFWKTEAERFSCLASWASLFRTPRDEIRALLEVRPEYLDAAFAAIDEKYGSFDNYLHRCLYIDDATLERLRAVLLE